MAITDEDRKRIQIYEKAIENAGFRPLPPQAPHVGFNTYTLSIAHPPAESQAPASAEKLDRSAVSLERLEVLNNELRKVGWKLVAILPDFCDVGLPIQIQPISTGASANETKKIAHDNRFFSSMDENQRKRLVRLLGKLGSDAEQERATAALKIDFIRQEHGLSWDELLLPTKTDYEAE